MLLHVSSVKFYKTEFILKNALDKHTPVHVRVCSPCFCGTVTSNAEKLSKRTDGHVCQFTSTPCHVVEKLRRGVAHEFIPVHGRCYTCVVGAFQTTRLSVALTMCVWAGD